MNMRHHVLCQWRKKSKLAELVMLRFEHTAHTNTPLASMLFPYSMKYTCGLRYIPEKRPELDMQLCLSQLCSCSFEFIFFLQECIPNGFLGELQTLKHFERVLTTFCTPCPNIYNRNLLIPVITIDPLRLDLWEVGWGWWWRGKTHGAGDGGFLTEIAIY